MTGPTIFSDDATIALAVLALSCAIAGVCLLAASWGGRPRARRIRFRG